MKMDNELDPRLASLLGDLKAVPARDPRAASRARSQFLAQAVSAQGKTRHSMWNIFSQKEQFAMKLITTTLVIVGLLFGGSATVAAAQEALPTSALYQVKLVSEEADLAFTADPLDKVDVLMEQAQVRTQEMAMLATQGTAPDEALLLRTQNRIQQALRLTADLNDDAAMTATLTRIREQLQTQDQQMLRLQDGSCTDCDPILQRTRDMLHTQLHEVENGLADPQAFRNMYRHQNQTRTTQTPGVTGTLVPTDVTVTPQGSCTPALDGTGEQYRNGNGNPAPGTPGPQNNDGSGNGTGNGSGSGSGSGNDNGSGNGSGSGSQTGPSDNGNQGTPPAIPGGQGGKP